MENSTYLRERLSPKNKLAAAEKNKRPTGRRRAYLAEALEQFRHKK
jgi:hypothetical protein